MKTASIALVLVSLSNVAAFSVVRPWSTSRIFHQHTQHPAFAKISTKFFAEKDDSSSSTAVLEKEATVAQNSMITNGLAEHANTSTDVELKEPNEELSETKKLMQQVKEAGTAGVISYALWELGFRAISVPVVLFGYVSVTGHFPDLGNKEDMAKLGAEAFAFVNFARFAVPLRIGLALSTTPWIQENIVDRFFAQKEQLQEEDPFQ